MWTLPAKGADRLRLALAGVVLGVAVLSGSGGAADAAGPPPQVVQAGTWSWPIAAPWRILRGFEAPATRYSAGHRGLDLQAGPGDAIYAAEAGVVSFAGQVVDRPVLSISHPGDLISSIEPVQASVAKGESVARGQRIGTVGAGGHCSLTCVHFGVRLHGQYISPLLFLGGVPRAVLLPLPG